MGGLGTMVQNAGSAIASGAKSLYGDEKNQIQTGQPQAQGQDPNLAQKLLYGQVRYQQPQQGPTAAQRNLQTQASM